MTLGHLFTALFAVLCIAWSLSEAWIGARHRSGQRGEVRDQGTLRLLLFTVYAAIGLAVWCSMRDIAPFPHHWRIALFVLGCLLMAAGMPLRWWSVRTLAQFFTIDVAIRAGHHIIRRGPYRLLRHPSYTGALMTFWGFGLALGHWSSLLAVVLPVTAAFLWRIRIEERVLAQAFPADYSAYARETKRLIPHVW